MGAGGDGFCIAHWGRGVAGRGGCECHYRLFLPCSLPVCNIVATFLCYYSVYITVIEEAATIKKHHQNDQRALHDLLRWCSQQYCKSKLRPSAAAS